MPKSVSIGCISPLPSDPASRTLAGLRSRCTTPSAWLAASASAIWAVSSAAATGLRAPLSRR